MDEVTTQILVQIRDEIRGTNQRMDTLVTRVDAVETGLGSRLDSVVTRLDMVGEQLFLLRQRVGMFEDRQRADAIRLATELQEVKTLLQTIIAQARGRRDLQERIAACERDIDELKTRLE